MSILFENNLNNNNILPIQASNNLVGTPPNSNSTLDIKKYWGDIDTLKSHHIYSLKVENEHVKTKSFSERISYFFFGNTKGDEDLKNLIGSIVTCYSKYTIKEKNPANNEKFKEFIFGKIALLDSKFFDRTKFFQKDLEKADRKEIQNILSEEIENLRKDVKNFKKEKSIKKLEATSTLKCISRQAKAKLALKLGVKPAQNSGGSTESFIIQDVTGKKLGLYKSINDSTLKISRLIGFALRGLAFINRQIHYCRKKGNLPAIYADIAAFVASEHFHVNMTPGSMRLQLKEKHIDGLFLTWCNRFTDASKTTFSTLPSKKSLEQFQKMAAYDYFIGNLDRHTGNWMVNEDGEIRTIDNSNCFLDKNISTGWSDMCIRKKQYAWKEHLFAEYQLTPEVKKFITEQFTEENIESFISRGYQNLRYQGLKGGFLNEFVTERLKERGKVLRKLASKEDSTPKMLGGLYTNRYIAKFIEEH